MRDTLPVLLFAYARPAHLARTLACLRADGVSCIEAFADGPKGADDAALVEQTRAVLRQVDWCELRLTERPTNLGLGASVIRGVTEAASRHDAFLVWEDDLICARGTYDWLCAALRSYRNDRRVMSVTGWTHPRVTPPNVGTQPWFDGRAECWVWGTWSRAWAGMAEETALEKLSAAERQGAKADAYGEDLPAMARREQQQNIWAVRWLYHHFQHQGLCVRPPWSMVEHIGFDATATNAPTADVWVAEPLRTAPPVPDRWPEPREDPGCRNRWRRVTSTGARGWWRRLRERIWRRR